MSVSSSLFIHSAFFLFLSVMPLLHYPCMFSLPLSHTKSPPLDPVLSSHLHTRGLGLLIKDTKERVVLCLCNPKYDADYFTFIDYPQVFNCLKNMNKSLSCSGSISCLPLSFLCMLSPTVCGLFWLVHNHCQMLFLTLPLLSQIFSNFWEETQGLKKKQNKETRCREKLLKRRR